MRHTSLVECASFFVQKVPARKGFLALTNRLKKVKISGNSNNGEGFVFFGLTREKQGNTSYEKKRHFDAYYLSAR